MEKITKDHPLSKSEDILQSNIETLKSLFPTIVKEGKIDLKELEALLSDEIETSDEYYRFNWAGKSDARREANKPSTATLRPSKEESKNWDTTENIFIEGDNLEVLKLLQKSYANQVKMIYIDPPYNTGKDFVYKDNYADNLSNYLAITGQIDEEGKRITTNTESDGRYHSNWLNMMYPRLKLARNVLKDDGVIYISIDENEVFNLRKLCDEIFGEENFVTDLVWKKRVSPANDSQWFSSDHEYILVYAKSKSIWTPYRLERNEKQNSYYSNPDNDIRGDWNSAAYTCNKSKDERPNLYYGIINPFTKEEIWPRTTAVWAYSQETHEEHLKDNLLYWGADGKSKSPRKKQFISEAKKVVPRSVLDYTEVGSTQSSTLEFLKIFEHNYFNYTKPIDLLKRLIVLSTIENDIILDFFAGSGTTAHATMKLNSEDGFNRKSICVQIPEPIDEKSEAFKSGFKTIAEITKERIRRAGTKIVEELKNNSEEEKSKKSTQLDFDGDSKKLSDDLIEKLDIGFKVFKLDTSNINSWDGSVENFELNLLNTETNIKIDRTEEDVLFEVLLKYGLNLTVPIEEKTINKCKVYSVGLGTLFVCLSDNITTEVAEELGKWKEQLNPTSCRVLFKDNGFKDDVAKTNSIQILKRFAIQEINSL